MRLLSLTLLASVWCSLGSGDRVMDKSYPSKSAIERAGHEMKVNPPKQLAKTAKKFGKADAKRQRVAIMLSKARKSGG